VDHVTEHHYELRHLECGEVLLPPQELLVLGTEGGHGVVGVHDHVDERVDQRVERAQTAGRELDAPPPGESHEGVVKDVQERDVLVFLPRDEEVRVQELDVLGQPEVEADVQHSERLRGIPIIALLADQRVARAPARHQEFIEKVR